MRRAGLRPGGARAASSSSSHAPSGARSPAPSEAAAGALFLVSTPIGNLGDITHRAEEVLRSADAVLCEDTRHSRVLLERVGVRTRLESHHEHNEARETPRLVARLLGGERLALISDAGTPGLSDPGARLVRAAIAAGVQVVPVPGASALLAAVVASGLVDGPFTYAGFLERQGRSRARSLARLSASPWPTVVYESGNRLAGTLDDIAARAGGARPVAVCRELTKRFEEFRRGTAAELASYYRSSPPRGEIVIVIGIGTPPADTVDRRVARDEARRLLAEGMSVRDVARLLLETWNLSRNEAYALASEGRLAEEKPVE